MKCSVRIRRFFKRRSFAIFYILFYSNMVFAQNFSSRIEKGEILEIQIIPQGDAWTDPDDEHVIKIQKYDSVYVIEHWNNQLFCKKEIIESDAHEIISFFENWKADRCRGGECGLTNARVYMKIGKTEKKFRSRFYYGHEIIDIYLKAATCP